MADKPVKPHYMNVRPHKAPNTEYRFNACGNDDSYKPPNDNNKHIMVR